MREQGSKLTLTDTTIARLLKDGVSKQVKISGDKGLYISIGKSGTATFWLRYTDKRIGEQAYHELGAWHAEAFNVAAAEVQASIMRQNISRDIYPSKQLQAGNGIMFPALVDIYVADCKALVNKPVKNRPSEFITEPRLRTWYHTECYLARAAAFFNDRFASALNKDDMGAIIDSITKNASSNRMRQNLIALCKWGNNNTNPETGKPYLEVNWFTDFMKPRKKELGIQKRLKGEPVAVFWRTLRSDPNCPGSEHSRRALSLMLCTGLRGKEVCSLHRNDVIDIDGKNPRVYIHPSNVKMLRYMVVPLNGLAVEIIKEAMASHNYEALFPSVDRQSVHGKAIQRATLTKLMAGDKGHQGLMDYLGWKGTPLQI